MVRSVRRPRGAIAGACVPIITLVLLAMALLGPASDAYATPSGFTWSGGDANNASSGDYDWSDANNWSSGTAPASDTDNGDLTFPDLSYCDTGSAGCYSENDLTGASFDSIWIDSGDDYFIDGNGITLGSGITATRTGSTYGDVLWEAPITLADPQAWSVSNGANLVVTSPVTGTGEALTANFNDGYLTLGGDDEVGGVTASGNGILALENGSKLDASDGGAVVIRNGITMLTEGSVTTGPLSISPGLPGTASGQLAVGVSENDTLTVNGAASLEAGTTTEIGLNGSGTSILSATGAVTVAGSLELTWAGNSCAALTPGTVYTIVSGSSVNGTFDNLGPGSTTTVRCQGADEGTVAIGYTANSVTATVLSASTTALQTPSPSNPVTGQSVTLTATVSGGSGAPTGTVAFENHGTTIAGCGAVALSNGEASCGTTFTAASSPESLTASYTRAADSDVTDSSTASATPLNVAKDATSTSLATSDSSPVTGEQVTYTATVTAVSPGSGSPTGSVEFDDGGTPISGCGSQTLDASTGKATCQVTYSASGAHTITASYGGDGNFTSSSTASGQSETVSATTSTSAVSANPSSPVTNQSVTLTSTVTSGYGSPTGTVEFDDKGSAITGCSAQSVDPTSGTATCVTSFAASGSPESLTATYTPASGSGFLGSSTASATPLTVSKDVTSTSLATSDASPTTGEQVTYTATVTPDDSGAQSPTGTVEFDDGGTPIDGCGSQTVDASTGKATCQVTYSAAGAHTITASYSGDGNFLGSSSPESGQSERVEPPIPVNGTAPAAPSGIPRQGQTLTAATGSWSPAPDSYTYAWERCDAQGDNCTAIPGATGSTYTLTAADVGKTVVVLVTAHDGGGDSRPSTSAHTAVIQALTSGLTVTRTGSAKQSGNTVDPGLTLACGEAGACQVTETLTALHGGKRVVVGVASFTVPASGTSSARLTLNATGRSLLRVNAKLPATLTVTAGGKTTTEHLTLVGTRARYSVSDLRIAPDGSATLRVHVTAPGKLLVLLTAWNDNVARAAEAAKAARAGTGPLQPAQLRFASARTSVVAKRAGTVVIRLTPSARGRRLMASHRYRPTFRLWVSYLPNGGARQNVGFYGLHVGTYDNPPDPHVS